MNIGIVGATGLVGKTLIDELFNHFKEAFDLYIFISDNAEPVKKVNKQKIHVCNMSQLEAVHLDVIFFATPPDISKQWIPLLRKNESIFVIDGSSAFREDENIPLIIPEINGNILTSSMNCVSSPNCTTTLALMALAPLHRYGHLCSFSLNSYQAASGVGKQGVNELTEQCKSWVLKTPQARPKAFPKVLFFNAIPQIGHFLSNGDTEEEKKVCNESRKILGLPNLKVFSTCVRVPVLQCHSLSISATFETDIALDMAEEILSKTPGVKFYVKDYPDTYAAMDNSLCHVGRLRMDTTRPHTLAFWVVGNQLLKGAATNMRQILELKLELSAR